MTRLPFAIADTARRALEVSNSLLLTIRAIIERNAVQVCERHFGTGVRALILTGSLARNEATMDVSSPTIQLYSDAEFICVLQNSLTLPNQCQAAALGGEIAEQISGNGVRCHVSLGVVHDRFLRKMRPHIFAYELKRCGRVVSGDKQILSLVPAFTPEAIPLEDAWRLLCNRMVELLESSILISNSSTGLPREVFYKVVKMYMDMATSLLVFEGRYAPTYAGRARTVQLLSSQTQSHKGSPVDLDRFSEIVSACTKWKITGEHSVFPERYDSIEFWRDAICDVHSLWRWELARMTKSVGDLPDCELIANWMRQQALQIRIRGWLVVLREQEWLKNWRKWPQWCRHILSGSPRHRIYAAASQLLFAIPNIINGGVEDCAHLSNLSELLPLPSVKPGVTPNWRQLASSVSRNYQQFVVNTQA